MPPTLKDSVASLVAAHGAAAVSSEVAAHAGVARPGSEAAGAYITSIITGDQAFDEATLHRVSNVLATGAKAGAKVGG
jgi:hypothetical protein